MSKKKTGRLGLVLCLAGTLLLTACLGCRPAASSGSAGGSGKTTDGKTTPKSGQPKPDIGP